MKLQSSEPDNSDFDLIIIGHGLQSALLLAQAASQGLKTALIAYNDLNEAFDQSPFIQFGPKSNQNLCPIHLNGKLIKSLKKSFAHLFIHSNSIHYGKLNFIQKLILKILELFSKTKMVYKSQNTEFKLPSISCSSYKFSSSRMSISLFKEAINKGASIYQHARINYNGFDERGNYKIEVTGKNNHTNFFKTKSILTFYNNYQHNYIKLDKLSEKNLYFSYFTYPAANLEIKKNILYKSENEYFNIIIWFDLVYFEYANQALGYLTLDFLIKHLNYKFSDIQLEKSLVVSFGSYKMSSLRQNKSKIQLVYLNGGSQINFKYKPINQWFDYSNKICNQIVKQIKKGTQSPSIIGKTVFQGSNLPEISNPLRIMEFADEKFDQAKHILKSRVYFKKLFYKYGSDIEQITNYAYEYWNQTKDSRISWLKAELKFSVEHEFCSNASDFTGNRSEKWMESPENIDEIENLIKEFIG